ncbi:hypothetical protein EOM82_07005 [bacterium]|nr:hypothetical protein [bacterium]
MGDLVISTIDGAVGRVYELTANDYEAKVYYVMNLTGPQGPQGPQGEQGPQGIQGEKGETGADGGLYSTLVTVPLTGVTYTNSPITDTNDSWYKLGYRSKHTIALTNAITLTETPDYAMLIELFYDPFAVYVPLELKIIQNPNGFGYTAISSTSIVSISSGANLFSSSLTISSGTITEIIIFSSRTNDILASLGSGNPAFKYSFKNLIDN